MRRPAVARLRNIVSDHAIVRYLERVVGIDPESIREQIIGTNASLVRRLDTGEIKSFEKGLKLVIRGGVVVTVLPLDSAQWKQKHAPGAKKCRAD